MHTCQDKIYKTRQWYVNTITVSTLSIIQFSDLKQHSRDWIVLPSSANMPTQFGSIDRGSLYLQKVLNKKLDHGYVKKVSNCMSK
jgi:hypothetical protein